MRELPRGAMSRREAGVFVAVASAAFIGASYELGRLCFQLSPVALAIVFWYSLAKRFTTYTQMFLALAMAVAPVGGWLAAGGPIGALEPWLLGAAIGAWVGGFDILYACQDLDFDRAAGLKSIPVRFGVKGSLLLSRLMHVVAVMCRIVRSFPSASRTLIFFFGGGGGIGPGPGGIGGAGGLGLFGSGSIGSPSHSGSLKW